jgi:hypothetical protein
MAYNPFDDVIENDPAYMQTGGELQRSVLPQRRVNYDQETFKPIATAISKGYKLLTPEQDTLEEIEKNKQLRELSTAQALRGTKFEEFAGQADLPSAVIQSPGIKERLDAAGYKPQGFIEGMSRTGQFFYGDQRQAYDKLASGQQLTDQDRTAIAMSPLDSLDFLFPPLLIKKLGSMGLKTVDDVLKSTADIQEVKQIKNYFGGQGFTPAGVVREADMGGSGGFTPRSGVSIEQQKRLKAQEEETLKLAEILKKDLDEDKNLTMQQLVEKYNLQGITVQGRKDLKKTSNEILKKEVPELFKDRTSPKNRNIQKRKKGDEQLLDYLQKKRESGEKFESFSAIADDLVKLKETMPTLQVKNRKSLANRYNENPQFAELFDEIIDRPEKVQAATDRFQEAYNKIPLDNKLKLLGEETFKSINPEMFDSINRLSQVAGKEKGYSATNLFSRFLYDKYRSIKESDNPLGIVTEDDFFQKLKFTDQDVKDLKSEFSDYVMLERDRLYMQNEGLNFMNNLLDNPQYKPYLVNAKGEFDQKSFTVNKLHDVPLFQARKEGKGRLKKVGRFLNTGTDPEFLNPHFQPYNRLMVDLDPTLNKLADFLNQKGLMKQASNMNAKVIPKVKDKKGNLKTPDSRINFITEGIVKLINDKGFNLDPTGKKQDVFLKEVAEAIDDIYKERGLRAVVPTLKGAKNESQIFGVENPKEIDLDTKIDQYKEALINALDYAVENNISPKDFRTTPKKEGTLGYLRFLKKGGPVKMAMGGDPLANMNQQQFMPDPAFEGEDYFNQAVESGNLYAFNPGKIFKLFSKTDAVYTPKKLPDPVGQQQAAPPGTTLPTTQVVQPEDFAFQSFTLNKINDPQAPKAGTPEAWRQFLYGGGQGGKVPEAEMFDTGLEQYLDDYARYYPDQKITKEQLNNYYEMSPIGNIEIKVKSSRDSNFAPHSPSAQDPAYKGYVGGTRHKEAGSQPLDRVGTDYREIVVKAGALPGDKKPFVSSGHYEEENVLGFTRVADYLQPNGGKVSVIQEMQTDMLTKVRKEQERLNALLKRIENIKANAAREIQSGDPYREGSANRALEVLNAKFPPAVEEALRKHSDLIKPFPNEAARSSIPDYQKQMMDLQKNIDEILASDLQQSKPETPFRIQDISQQQQKVLDGLLDLNRSSELEEMLKNVQVPGTSETESLLQYGTDPNVRDLETGARYMSLKNLELFPPIPFNKQADYVDLLLKSTIKDAQARGINKVAVYPPDLINQRWGKNPDSDAGKKFRDLYGKVAIQQMKNIAKKYGGDAKVETVLNPDASNRGLTYYKTNVDGEYEFMKQDQLAQGLEPEEAQMFINEQLKRNANSLGANQVIYSREIAPGQTMDYYVQPKTVTETTDTGGTIDFEDFELVPLGPGDDRNAAQVLIEEYNPQEVQMFTITLDSDKAKGPMFMFKKKSGGSIDKDSLVSITDIFGEYGR